MRRIAALLTLSFLVVSTAYPCSNKYAGRSARLLMKPAVRPASILILNNQSLRVYAKSLKSTLQQLGHKVKEVKSPEEITTALQSGKGYDIVMADVEQMGTLAEQIATSASGVVAVPLVSKKSKEGVSTDYPFAVNLSAKSTIIRKKIDEAMEQKEKESKEKV